MNKIIRIFDERLETVCEYEGYKYSISETAVIIILGLVCGLENVSQIHQWASAERTREFLKNHFNIEHIPCYYWMTCLLKLIVPESLTRCFTCWVESTLPSGKKGMTISFDGKTIRSTVKDGSKKSPLHIVSAQLAEKGITFGQKAVDEKSNEIPAVQSLLEELDVSGCIVVADALNCQKKTAGIIIENKADYLLDAKDNQRNLKTEIKEYVEDKELRAEMDSAETKEKNRDRVEKRTAYTTNNIDWLTDKAQWKSLSCIGAIHIEVDQNGRNSDEWHYYISSKKLTARELLDTARKEWSVETMHWLLDVRFGEDFCRLLSREAQKNMNILRKTALNMVRTYKKESGTKLPFTKIMLGCLLDPDKLLDIVYND